MSHFSVVACVQGPDQIGNLLAPFDENLEVEPYRDYEEGGPAGYWAADVLRKEAGLNPDDATLTWAELAEAYNKRYGDEDDPLLIDDSGRAYTMSTRNPQAKWDYWRIGGRWGGYFCFRPELASLVIKPERGWDSPEIIRPDYCDGGPKRALDLPRMRNDKAAEARKLYAEWTVLTAGTPDALPWSAFAENISEGNGYTAGQAREEYHSQPRVQALKGSEEFRWRDDPIAEFQIPGKLYVERERARAVPGYATVTLDGRWMAPGEYGWFGMHTDGEGDRIGYWEAANAYIESLPGDTWLIVADCHI